MRKFVFFIIILTLLTGIAGFYYYQKNIYSKEVLKLEILGPQEAELLTEIEYLVKYKNNGNVRLEEPNLIFERPKNSLWPEGKSQREEITLEDIYPGEEKTFSFKVKLFGKEGEAKEIKAWLKYRPKNLKSFFESATTFTTLIKKVPLTFDLDLPLKIESIKDFNFRINYFSNLDYPLSDLRIQIEYPSGFEFLQSNPKSIEKTEWQVPILNKSQGGRIEIFGRISGEIGQSKIFKAKIGIWKEGEFILLKEVSKGVEFIKPSLYLRQEINGNPQYTAQPGDLLHYEIYFKNLGEESLNNLFLIVQLESQNFDFQSIKSDLAEYRPGDNSLVFDWRKIPKLQYLFPLEEGKVEFWIKLKEDLEDVKEPILKNKVIISQVKEEFITKISSKLEITQKGFFQDEIFDNSGPLPPKVGQVTTFTVVWSVENYYSDVKDIKVKTILPKNVQLTGKIFPEEEISRFSFDSNSREIVWSIGNLEKGTGLSRSGPTIAFQIAFIPNVSQEGQNPELIGQTEIIGQDSWTEITLKTISPAININSFFLNHSKNN